MPFRLSRSGRWRIAYGLWHMTYSKKPYAIERAQRASYVYMPEKRRKAMAGALDGIKILELTRVGPGAFCTMMLADMGAEVLKIEPPPSGKLAGSGASPKPEEARKLATNFTNRTKKSLTLNLKHPAGQAVLQDLAKGYDVLVEGFRPGVMQRLGGDYQTLSKLNPRLVYCSLSGYGQDGPDRRAAGDPAQYCCRLRRRVDARRDRHHVRPVRP